MFSDIAKIVHFECWNIRTRAQEKPFNNTFAFCIFTRKKILQLNRHYCLKSFTPDITIRGASQLFKSKWKKVNFCFGYGLESNLLLSVWCKLRPFYTQSLDNTFVCQHSEWIWRWYQLRLVGVFKNLLISQLIPENPGSHWHVNWFTPSVQLPPFWHGLGAQSSISENK